MSAATETIIEKHVNGTKSAVKAFSDKNTSGTNGFKKAKTSKEYFSDIVKEAISEELLDDDGINDSTSLVVGKVIEIEDKIVNSELVKENNSCLETDEVSVNGNEDNQRMAEAEQSSENKVESIETNEQIEKSELVDCSPDQLNTDFKLEVSSDIFIEDSDLKVPGESVVEISDVNTLSSLTDTVSNSSVTDKNISAVGSEKNVESTELESITRSVVVEGEEMSTEVDKLVNKESERIPEESNSNDNCNEANIPTNCEVIEDSNCNPNLESENDKTFEKQSSINENEGDVKKNQTPLENNVHLEAETLVDNEIKIETKETIKQISKTIDNLNCNEILDSSLNSENNCVSNEQNVTSCPKNDFLKESNSENNDILLDSQEINPEQVQNGNITENLSEKENTIEVISTKVDENADKTIKPSLKRPPTPDKDDNETSKKIKISDPEGEPKPKINKRLSTECSTDEPKKLRASNSKDKEPKENSDVKENKENNVNFQSDEKNDENKKEKSDKIDRIKELKKVGKEKLKKIKEKKEKDAVTNVNGKSESSTDADSGKSKVSGSGKSKVSDCGKSKISDGGKSKVSDSGKPKVSDNGKSKASVETSENKNSQSGVGKLKLKKKRKGPDDDDEYELYKNSRPTSCPLCSCGQFKKVDRKILGEKTRGIMDILSDGSDNININLVQKLEELVGQTVVDWATNKCDVGLLRRRAHFLEEEHDRLIQLTTNLKKQLDDAKCIMKRMVDEKLAQKSWSEGIVPLKVTRSVGMQVCTTGSAHVLIKRQDEKDRDTSRLTSPRSSSSSFSTNVTTPELQMRPYSSESNKQTVGVVNNTISNAIARSVSVSNALKAVNDEIIRLDTSTNVVGSSRIISSGRATPRQADGAQKIVNVNIIDDDIEVVEPIADKPPQPTAQPPVVVTTATINNNNQILINGTLATFSTAANTTPTTSAPSKPIAPGIYILKTTEVPTPQNTSNHVQVPIATPVQAATPTSEVIDLTDNDPVAYTTNSSNPISGNNRSPLRLSAGQTAPTQNTVNFALATTGAQSKVVTFPADSTTFVIHRSPNTPNNGAIRKAGNQPTTTSDILLTSMSALPPLPRCPKYGINVLKPPKPTLRICKNSTGIMLSWNFDEEIQTIIRKYQVFAYQEGTPIDATKTDMWKKVGDVDALPLPMACTLTQFKEGHRYYFVVRAMDKNSRLGEFSLPGSIMLTSSSSNAVNKSAGTRV